MAVCTGSGKYPSNNTTFRDPKYKGFGAKEGFRGKCAFCGEIRALTPRFRKVMKHQLPTKSGKRLTAPSKRLSTKPKRIRLNGGYDRPAVQYANAYNAALGGKVQSIHGRTKMTSALGRAWIMGTLDGFGDTDNIIETNKFVEFLRKEKGVIL